MVHHNPCRWHLLIAILLAVVFSPHATSLKHTSYYESGGVFGKFLVQRFGMAVGGVIDIDYDVSAQQKDESYESYMLIVVLTNAQKNNLYYQLDDSDAVIKGNIVRLCSQPAALRSVVYGKGKLSLKIDHSIGRDRFSVALLQCRDGSNRNPVSADITVEMRNARPNSEEGYSHLAIQDVMITRVLEGELILYSLLILGLLGQFYAGKEYVQEVHWLFLTTLISTFVFILVQYNNYYHYNKEGTNDFNLSLAVDALRAITTTLILGNLLVLALGWSLVRAVGSITFREFRIVGCALLIFFVFALSAAICDGNSDACEPVNLVAFILRSLLLLGIIVAVNFTGAQLRSMILHSPWVPSTPIQYARIKQYQMFRIMFILYLLLPTIFIIIQGVMFTWKEDWVIFMLNDLLDVLMFFHVGVTFSPLHERLLIRAFDGSQQQQLHQPAAAAVEVPVG